MKLDKPLTFVAAYKSVCVREMIAITEKKLDKYQSYKSPSFPALQPLSSAKGLAPAATGKGEAQ